MGRTEASRKMKKACVVIFAREDVQLSRLVVAGLQSPRLIAWSSEDLNHGNWEQQVREKMDQCDAVIPIVTRHTRDKSIFVDEWHYAESRSRPIFPFIIEPEGIPLGMGRNVGVEAPGWTGDCSHSAFVVLKQRLNDHFFGGPDGSTRPESLALGSKSMRLPSFVFSLSSFETQLDPINGLQLMEDLNPMSCLISAYDIHGYLEKGPADFRRPIQALHRSPTIMFLDSGHYEATRKDDYRTRKNPAGWSPELFHEAANAVPADIVFSYDNPEPDGSLDSVIEDVFKRYERDWLKTGLGPQTLCPIVHVPPESNNIPADAAHIVARVAREIRPTLIAIPERELGDGVMARMKSVKLIRRALDELGHYQALHILGTGNPITIAALSVCGADSFDGLEWCRTAASYETNHLLHFQQFDLLKACFAGRMSNQAARGIVEHDQAPFALRVASYNYDYFCDWMSNVQHWVHSAQPERMFNGIPYLGTWLAAEYKS